VKEGKLPEEKCQKIIFSFGNFPQKFKPCQLKKYRELDIQKMEYGVY